MADQIFLSHGWTAADLAEGIMFTALIACTLLRFVSNSIIAVRN